MEEICVSRWELVKNTKSMMTIAVIYTTVVVGCLYAIVVNHKGLLQTFLVIIAFLLLLNFRRILAYYGDIIQKRIRVLEGAVRKLVCGVDYESKVKPVDYDIYEIMLGNGEALRFPCAHNILDIKLAKKVRFVLLESTLDIVKAEVLDKAE